MARPPSFASLPDSLPASLHGVAATIGFAWTPIDDLDLSEGHLLDRKKVPVSLIQALRRGWERAGVPPVFAVKPQGVEGASELQDGHRRWLAAKRLGLREVPVVWVDSDGFLGLLDTPDCGDRLGVRDVVFSALGLASVGRQAETNG